MCLPKRSPVIQEQTSFYQKHLLNKTDTNAHVVKLIPPNKKKKRHVGQDQDYLRFWKMLPRPIPRPLPLAATEERKHQG